MPANISRTAVTDPQHIQDENGDIVGYMKGFNTLVYTRVYGNATTASRTATTADLEQVLDCNSGSAIVITIPNDDTLVLPDAAYRATIGLYQKGAGAVSFTAGAGVTLRGTAPTAAQYTTVGIMRVGANEWAYL
jgi:hypothetical protein